MTRASHDLAGARVLVTGGAGFVGSTIADRLLDEGVADVVLLDNLVRARKENVAAAEATGRARFVEGDVRDRDLVHDLTAGVDLVFHQAALRITRCAEAPREGVEVMVDGTLNVIEAAVAAGVDTLVYASSASVYGQATTFPTPEGHHGDDDLTLYGAAKRFGEGLLRSVAAPAGIRTAALRYFNVYGPRMDIHGAYTEVLVRWMERIAAGEPPLILGDGSDTMDVVFIDDVARANVLAAGAGLAPHDQPGPHPEPGRAYNIARGTEISLSELADALLVAMGSDLRPEHGPARAVAAVPRRLADVTRARDELSFTAEVGLGEGLARLVAWWRTETAHSEPAA